MNYAADHEAIINYATEKTTVDSTEYTADQFCPRIAGLLAGTPITMLQLTLFFRKFKIAQE